MLETVDFLGQLIDGSILLVDLLSEGGVFEHKFPDCLLQDVDFRKLAAKRIQLLVQSRQRVLHGGGWNGVGGRGRFVVLSLIRHWQKGKKKNKTADVNTVSCGGWAAAVVVSC